MNEWEVDKPYDKMVKILKKTIYILYSMCKKTQKGKKGDKV